MKLLTLSQAPNPKRLSLFLAEKGIEIETLEIDPGSETHRSAPYFDATSSGHFPVLQFEDGTFLAESIAICRFLETLHPEPRLFGRNPRESAEIEMWDRRIELGLFRHTGDYFGHTASFFADRIDQIPAFAASAKKNAHAQLGRIDRALAGRAFLASEHLSVADLTLFVALDLGTPSVFEGAAGLPNLSRWEERMNARKSIQDFRAP